MRCAVVERVWTRWARQRVRMPLVRMTAHCVVLRAANGREAWFDRATGQGQRGGNGAAAARSGDWRGWRIVWSASPSDLWAAARGGEAW